MSKYKEYENDILNDKYLKERKTNDINSNELDKIMPRGKTKKKPSISADEELERKIKEFDMKMINWWNLKKKKLLKIG